MGVATIGGAANTRPQKIETAAVIASSVRMLNCIVQALRWLV